MGVAHRNSLAGTIWPLSRGCGTRLLLPIYTSLGAQEIAGTLGLHRTNIVKTRDAEIRNIFLL